VIERLRGRILKLDNSLERYTVPEDAPLRTAIQAMDKGGIGFVAVVRSDGIVAGILTDGDFRRAMLAGRSLNEPIGKIANQEFVSVAPETERETIRDLFIHKRLRHIPVIEGGRMVGLIHEDEFFLGEPIRSAERGHLEADVVVMAGGKGTRLEPFTTILPKPLIPVGDKTILEVVLDRFRQSGVERFYVSVNHMAHIIKAYFEDKKGDYAIEYLEETEPRGTCGSLVALRGKVSTPFFVTNCDTVIMSDYEAIHRFHTENGSDLTLVASMKHVRIPYGVCTIKDGGELHEIVEKPHYDVMANTGLYILSPRMLNLIPERGKFDMTELIALARQQGYKVHVFPIREAAWLDVGEWDEYRRTVRQLVGAPAPVGL
jgi:dTDP-glucose pyrophosphorylase